MLKILILLASAVSYAACQSAHQNDESPSTLWLYKDKSQKTEEPSERLAEVIRRIGPNMRASSDYHDYQDIKLNESIEAWHLLHRRVEAFAKHQVQFYGPKIEEFLQEANVSAGCRLSVAVSLESMKTLNSRAIRMWSSSGNFPPVGLFDGQFSDLGSYMGCVDASRYLSYCLLPFRPITPSRKAYHRIFEQEDGNLWRPNNLTSPTSDNIFTNFASFAQYFHYVHLQTGVCVPYECTHYDMQQVAKLVASNLYMMAGPVRCFTRAKQNASYVEPEVRTDEIENEPTMVLIGRPIQGKQFVALALIGSFYALVILATVWHSIEIFTELKPIEYSGIKRVAFYYLSLITNGEDFLDTTMKRNEIKCLHGFRVGTMCWIISVHTLQYNQWSGFTRIFENVRGLQNPVAHPIYNANYVVDNFFLMSGLLASYTTWYSNKGTSINFSILTSLVARYLRLTPQVLLVSLLYIALPLVAHGPFWFDMTYHAAKYCEKNWWVNLLHLQVFYRKSEMCNLVGWWISVDMFYYIIGLGLLWMILNSKQTQALLCTVTLVVACMCATAYMHFHGGYPPNNLGVVPQVAEVWTQYVVEFFWSPFPHAFPFYLGLWLGYVMANNKWRQQVRRWAKVGWFLSIGSMATVNMSSYIWMSGFASLDQNQNISTTYNIACTTIWALGFGWIITACHYGCAPRLNRLLSMKLFVLMSKASFIVYLSHMLIIRTYFGLQSSLLEVSMLQFIYIMIGNIFLSSVFGVFLCISFEGPWMKVQRFVVQKVRPNNGHLPIAGSSYLPQDCRHNLQGLEDHDNK